MTGRRQNILLVEGNEDQYAIIALMAKYVEWGDRHEDWPVKVVPLESINNLTSTRISTTLKSADVVGIVVDADDDFDARWAGVRNLLVGHFPRVPRELPANGLVADNTEGKRLGVWIMPDNQSRGMLETFLQFLVPEPQEAIWLHAQEATVSAVRIGATCKNVHRDKSNIHAWLAWQDPPGRALGNALKQNMLDARAPYVEPFVSWFCDLFDLPRRIRQ